MSERETQASAGQYNADFETPLQRINDLIDSQAPVDVVQVALLKEILIELQALRTDLRGLRGQMAVMRGQL